MEFELRSKIMGQYFKLPLEYKTVLNTPNIVRRIPRFHYHELESNAASMAEMNIESICWCFYFLVY